jgi:hypothetical protein
MNLTCAKLFFALAVMTIVAESADPLPSWNEGRSKKSIMDFVTKVTKPGSPDFVPESEHIATFDNDGTLWAEHLCSFSSFLASTDGSTTVYFCANTACRSRSRQLDPDRSEKRVVYVAAAIQPAEALL